MQSTRSIWRALNGPSEPLDGNVARRAPPGLPHVESWFAKLVDPESSRALWIKCTVLARDRGDSVAEAWAISFAQDRGPIAAKETQPIAAARFGAIGLDVRACRLKMEPGRISGNVERDGHNIEIDLKFTPGASPLELLPMRAMYSERFPATKLLSPHPDSRFSGHYTVDGVRVEVHDWRGMQGHNWGRRHTPRYAWAHVNQWERGEELLLEGCTAQPVSALPAITLLCVASRGVRYRFTSLRSILSARGTIGARSWNFSASSDQAEVEGELCADAREFAGLLYENPSGAPLFCLNSKLAQGRLRFTVRGRPSIELQTRAAALELGTMDPQHGVQMIA
jgi:hypothetical protein